MIGAIIDDIFGRRPFAQPNWADIAARQQDAVCAEVLARAQQDMAVILAQMAWNADIRNRAAAWRERKRLEREAIQVGRVE